MFIVAEPGLRAIRYWERVKDLRSLGMDTGRFDDDAFLFLDEAIDPRFIVDRDALRDGRNGPLISYLLDLPQMPLTIHYRDVAVTWHKRPGTGSVVLDSLVHLEAQEGLEGLAHSRRIADVFCGLGVAGKHAALRAPEARVDFSDLIDGNIASAKLNTRDLAPERIGFALGNGLEPLLKERPYDLITASAVPATPIPPGVKVGISPFNHGTDAVERLVEQAPYALEAGGRLVFSYSGAGEYEVAEALTRSGARSRELARREVGYRAQMLGNDDVWIDFLLERGGLRRDERGFVHDVIVNEVRYS